MPKRRFDETGWHADKRENIVADDKALEQSLKAAAEPQKKIEVKKPSALTPPKKSNIANVAKATAPVSHKTATIKAAEIADTFSYDTAMHMAFIGAGQGGGKIAQSFWDVGYRRVGVFNTTDSDFSGLADEMPKLSLDIGGAGKDMKLARNAMKGQDEEIWDLYGRAWGTKFDCALICIGLGGGSGSGAGLPLINLARKYMTEKGLPPRVGAIVSLPSVDEGQQVARNAVAAFNELLAAGVSPLIIIDNDKVNELYRPPMSQLLPKSNELISQLFHLLNQLAATRSKHITFDRAEFAQLLDSGIVVFGSADLPIAEISEPADVSAKIKEQLAASVLADVDLRTGKKAACVFVASNEVLDTYGKEYFAAGFTMLNRIVGSACPPGTEVVVHRGLYPESEDGLQCYTMIGGLEPPVSKLNALAKEAGVTSGQMSSVGKHLKVD